MDDPILELIEQFQNYIGKRIQRFHPKIPGICSYYGLGWMRLERVIQIRKLMFMRTILVMEDEKILCDRARIYFSNENFGADNLSRSVVFDLLNVSSVFGLIEEVKNMIKNQHFYPKSVWRNIVWRRAWACIGVLKNISIRV